MIRPEAHTVDGMRMANVDNEYCIGEDAVEVN